MLADSSSSHRDEFTQPWNVGKTSKTESLKKYYSLFPKENQVPVFPAGLPDGGGVLRLPRGQSRGGQTGARRVLGVGGRVHAEEQDEDRPAAPLPAPVQRVGGGARVGGRGRGAGSRAAAAADP